MLSVIGVQRMILRPTTRMQVWTWSNQETGLSLVSVFRPYERDYVAHVSLVGGGVYGDGGLKSSVNNGSIKNDVGPSA